MLSRFSRYVYIAGVVLALVLLVPVAWFPFQLAKITLFAVALAVALLLFVFAGDMREVWRTHGGRLALLAGLLPLSYLVSAYFSVNRAVAVTGINIEVDTVLFVVLGFFAFILSFVLFRTLKNAQLLVRAVCFAVLGAMAVQWAIIIFGTSLILFQIFSDRSVNLIGKWNDFGILVALAGMFLLTRLELSHVTGRGRALSIVGVIAALILLGIVNFSLAWWFVLVGGLALALVAFFTGRKEGSASSLAAKMPWYAGAGALIAAAFLVFGSVFNTGLTSIFPVSSLEVRPSYSSTIDVINAARNNSAQLLWGTGPDTFNQAWLVHKSPDINQTIFWNLDFNVGFSTLLTAFGTVGILGVLAWCVPFLLVLLGIIRAIRLKVLSREERITAVMLGFGSIALFALLALYVPSQTVAMLFFVFSGATFGFLWRQGRSAAPEAPVRVSRIRRWGAIALSGALVLVMLWSAAVSVRYLAAQTYTSAGLYALQSGDTDTAQARAAASQRMLLTPDALRLTVDAGAAKIQQIAGSQTQAPSADVQKQFNDLVTQTITAGKQLIALSPYDYRGYMSLGSVYDLLAALQVQGAYESAKQAYSEAAKLNPSSPAIPLALARLEAGQKNGEAVQAYLTESLKLKPNYTDAILMVVQLDIANNDIPQAIRAATVAAQTAPGIAPIWFQLGLLYYANQDTKNAIPAFEQALSIVPDYANAKYFLGLSLEAQGKHAEAMQQFRDLAASNPDSAEVKLILSNLEAGKPPFDSAQPPVTDQPVERTAAPINE